jgi:hypothetical protein
MAEMCLYNGIKLPKMPKSPSYFEETKYAKYKGYLLFRTEDGNYEFYGTQRPTWLYEEQYGGIRINAYSDQWKLYNGRWIWYRYASNEPPDYHYLPLSQFVWANIDLLQATLGHPNISEVMIAGTDPVPVEQSIGMAVDHSVYVRGWFVGKRLAAMRGQAQQVVDTARLGLATLGRMILGKE